MAVTDQDELLRYYWRELTYLRKMGQVFARKHSKVAGRLELEADQSPDPHVERLIEAFAFLTGRIQYQIDNEFPEVASELLNALYPHYLNPVPSLSVAQFQVDPENQKLTSGYVVPKHSPLFATSDDDQLCRYRTCYSTTLWPLAVTEATLGVPEDYGRFNWGRASGLLRLKLTAPVTPLEELELSELRFFIDGDRMLVDVLYELLFANVTMIAIVGSDGQPRLLPEGSLQPVGFDRDQEVLPQPGYSHPAFRLVQEYFVFPDKYHFFDVRHLENHGSGRELELVFAFDKMPEERLQLTPRTFALGCTPIINLFPKTTEPIRVDHRNSEYRLVPDVHREKVTEIHSILSVSAVSDAADKSRDVRPFYSFDHEMHEKDHRVFWHSRRVPTSRPDIVGTDVLLSFLDLDFEPSRPPNDVLFAHTLCTNRMLAEYFPSQGTLESDRSIPVERIVALKKPTRQVSPPLEGQTLWRLISHLSLNHLSLSEGEESLTALREILRLYRFYDARSAEDQTRGITKMSQRKVVRQIGTDAWRGFCRGTEVTLEFDENMYVGSGAFLLAAVLNRFFALYASTNSFTELVIERKQLKGVWKKWDPMVGERVLL